MQSGDRISVFERRRRRRRLFLTLSATAVAVTGTILAVRWPVHRIPPEQRLAAARTALRAGRFAEAEEAARQVGAAPRVASAALLVAGEAATRQGSYDRALGYYRRLPDDGSEEALVGLFAAAELDRELCRLDVAEESYRALLRHNRHNVLAHRRLAFLLGLEGRRWESVPHLLEVVERGNPTVGELLLLGNPERPASDRALLEKCRTASPGAPLLSLGLARIALAEGRSNDAEELVEQALKRSPGLVEAHVALGAILLDRRDFAGLARWEERLPSVANDHPEEWVVRGRWAVERGETRGAIRCFLEAVRINPNHTVANYQAGQLLRILEQAAEAAAFLERASRLQALANLLDRLEMQRHDAGMMQEAAKDCEALGRLWEACAWARMASEIDPQLELSRRLLVRLVPRLRPDLPWTQASENPLSAVEISSFVLPQRPRPGGITEPLREATDGTARVRFEECAAAAGIQFEFFNGADPATEGMRMFEFTGGGVAVIDLDGDAWPDLYFTQGCPWPPDESDEEHRDTVYRNLGNGRFDDVTAEAGLGDNRYSQGAAVADFDNDGFPDLYVANIGVNRLYHNNGDGTFADVTAAARISGSRWTTSCLLADVNGDGLPDVYDVTYLTGENVYRLICQKEGKSRACNPGAFDAEQDQLYLNLGNGRFENVTRAAGLDVPDGKGLGIVAADFDGSGRLNLFVANDGVPNFYFANRTSARGAPPQFSEEAMLCGLAFDQDGRAKAGMGVAAGDADGNGLLDLVVTNYYHEGSTLYLQQAPNQFVDATRGAGLREPSFGMLGFGTQFVDADLDGLPDLVVTNGHVDDFSHIGTPYAMPPQYFHNVGGGRFVEAKGAALGQYFEGKYLGRGLARVDWNRDGREDVVISHLDAPAALLTNRTVSTGHFLALQLRGVRCARDAIGAIVSLRTGNQAFTQQLSAGDGYQASNQRQLVFGLADRTRIDEVQVRWPSGEAQAWHDLAADAELVLIEGRRDAVRLPQHPR
jgi:tetratricopeptide (TPR) repeat protein